MRAISHREFRTWREWDKEPRRLDYYLMQIAGYVSHVMSRKSWKLDDYRVGLEKVPVQTGATRQAVEQDKSRWNKRLGRRP